MFLFFQVASATATILCGLGRGLLGVKWTQKNYSDSVTVCDLASIRSHAKYLSVFENDPSN